jgi:hypothetical protein
MRATPQLCYPAADAPWHTTWGDSTRVYASRTPRLWQFHHQVDESRARDGRRTESKHCDQRNDTWWTYNMLGVARQSAKLFEFIYSPYKLLMICSTSSMRILRRSATLFQHCRSLSNFEARRRTQQSWSYNGAVITFDVTQRYDLSQVCHKTVFQPPEGH